MSPTKYIYPDWMNEEQAVGLLHSFIEAAADEGRNVQNERDAFNYLVAHLPETEVREKGNLSRILGEGKA